MAQPPPDRSGERRVSCGAGILLVLIGLGSFLDLPAAEAWPLRGLIGTLLALAGGRLLLRHGREDPPPPDRLAPDPSASTGES